MCDLLNIQYLIAFKTIFPNPPTPPLPVLSQRDISGNRSPIGEAWVQSRGYLLQAFDVISPPQRHPDLSWPHLAPI